MARTLLKLLLALVGGVGNAWDPDGAGVGSLWNPNGASADVGNLWDPNG